MKNFPTTFVPRFITILTGAGISAESGVPTFRDSNGLWENHRVEDVATPEAFEDNPALVQQFYNMRRRAVQQPSVQPNPAHRALAKLQREFDGRITLVTQNIDNLHEQGGSTGVIHMHGELLKVRCKDTGKALVWKEDITPEDKCPCCQKTGTLRPHIVWFGEMPMYMDDISEAIMQSDLFVAIGTSGNVYPAAGFAHEARQFGAHTLELNLAPGENKSMFNAAEYGKASEIVPIFVEDILSRQRQAGLSKV